MTNILQHFRVWAQHLEDSTHLRAPPWILLLLRHWAMGWQEVSLLFVSSNIFFTWSWAFCHSPMISECFQPCQILVSLCPEACLISASWLPPSPLPLPPPHSSTSEVFPSCPEKPVALLNSCKDVGTSRLSVRYKTACHTVTVTLKLDSLVLHKAT